MSYISKEEIREKYRKGNDLTKINAIPIKEQADNAGNDELKRVAVYCRVSTDGLSQVTSFELQKKYYIKYVRKHFGWKLVGVYSDEGISATSIKNRIGLQMMIRDAIEGKIDLIVIKSISRFCRNLEDSINIIKKLKSLPRPVGIFFETENMNTLDPAMDLIIKVLSIFAEGESKKKSEAITAACRQKYAEGFFNVMAVLGYRRVGVNKIEVDEEEAETVQLIYDMFLSGIDADSISKVLVELGRRKYTHVYMDGRVKEGKCDWNKESVLQIFENEKRCGDVLAQKTYTVDCIDHIVRKNENNVQMYYAIDQHPAIISRERFYLAKRIKDSNKGNWKWGVQYIQTYFSGPMRGFVRIVPNWHGYGYCDYVRASAETYGINLPDDSLYPDYVTLTNESNNENSTSVNEKKLQHLYLVSEEEFVGNVEFTEEELKLLQNKENSMIDAITNLREKMVYNHTVQKIESSARLFALNEKPVITFDRNGVVFSKMCGEILDVNEIEIYYNPIYNILLVGKALDNSAESVRFVWKKDNKMRRRQAVSLCETVYIGNGWNKQYKYRIIGHRVIIRDKKYIEFRMNDPIIRVTLKDIKTGDEVKKKDEDIMDKILKEVSSTEDIYSEIDDIRDIEDMEMISQVESRSRAVYFNDLIFSDGELISIEKYKDNKFDPDFVGTLRKNKIEPTEGWKYLDGMVRFKEHYFDLFSETWENRLSEDVEYVIDYNSTEVEEIRQLGWPTKYTFPSKEIVMSRINEMKRRIQ